MAAHEEGNTETGKDLEECQTPDGMKRKGTYGPEKVGGRKNSIKLFKKGQPAKRGSSMQKGEATA